jgi:hypothetical protein
MDYQKQEGASMPLKHLSEAQVREIIARATALNLAFPESEDGIEMHDPKAMQEVSTYLGSPECASLDRALRDLSDDGRFELMALMWLGRGDSGNDFGALINRARENSSPGDIDYISEKAPSLPVYLERGLVLVRAQK